MYHKSFCNFAYPQQIICRHNRTIVGCSGLFLTVCGRVMGRTELCTTQTASCALQMLWNVFLVQLV